MRSWIMKIENYLVILKLINIVYFVSLGKRNNIAILMGSLVSEFNLP